MKCDAIEIAPANAPAVAAKIGVAPSSGMEWIFSTSLPSMLRKTLYLFLGLLACALIVAGIDGVRHARALDRLDQRRLQLIDWRYRLGGGTLDGPRFPEGRLRAWWRRLVASPRCVHLFDGALDGSVVRDLAVVRMDELWLEQPVIASPDLMRKLSGISSIHQLDIGQCYVTDEALNLVWSFPNLETISIYNGEIGEDAFRDIHDALHLRRLTLRGWNITGEVIARVHEAPGLESLNLNRVHLTEASIPFVASMPALREVNWEHVHPDPAFVARLKAANPKLKLGVSSPMRQEL